VTGLSGAVPAQHPQKLQQTSPLHTTLYSASGDCRQRCAHRWHQKMDVCPRQTLLPWKDTSAPEEHHTVNNNDKFWMCTLVRQIVRSTHDRCTVVVLVKLQLAAAAGR
jgi:hypothetical protein